MERSGAGAGAEAEAGAGAGGAPRRPGRPPGHFLCRRVLRGSDSLPALVCTTNTWYMAHAWGDTVTARLRMYVVLSPCRSTCTFMLLSTNVATRRALRLLRLMEAVSWLFLAITRPAQFAACAHNWSSRQAPRRVLKEDASLVAAGRASTRQATSSNSSSMDGRQCVEDGAAGGESGRGWTG